MSPTAFKQQVGQLISELTRCNELCIDIRANRRVGSTTHALDQLQSGLKSGAAAIQNKYNTLQKLMGVRMDLGDDISRNAMNSNIWEIQSDITSRLDHLAYPRREQNESGSPGFRNLLQQWRRLEENVMEILDKLAQRLQQQTPKKTEKPAKPSPQEQAQTQRPHSPNDVLISLLELDKLLDHLKNSWQETMVSGEIIYVNCFDEKRSQWNRPDGFIREMARSSKLRPTTTHDIWNQPNGW